MYLRDVKVKCFGLETFSNRNKGAASASYIEGRNQLSRKLFKRKKERKKEAKNIFHRTESKPIL